MKHIQVVHRRFDARKQRGQGLTEYVLIVALIAIAAITVITMFGGTLRSQFAGVATELAGTSATSEITKAGDYASQARSDASNRKAGMQSYHNSSLYQ